MSTDNGGLTTRDILLRLDGKVDSLMGDMVEVKTSATFAAEVSRDHEKRLRKLERFRYSIPSVAVLSLLCSIALLVLYFKTSTHP